MKKSRIFLLATFLILLLGVAAYAAGLVPNAGGNKLANEGEEIVFNATQSVGTNITSYLWDFDDSSSGSGNITTHIYTDNGTYNVTLTISNITNSSKTSIDVAVSNVAPSVSLILTTPSRATPDPTKIYPNVNYFFTYYFADPAKDDTIVNATIDFGDGTNNQSYYIYGLTEGGSIGFVSVNHTYNSTGVYTVELNVTDDDGGIGTAINTTTVIAAPPVAIITSPANDSIHFRESGAITFSAADSYDLDGNITDFNWSVDGVYKKRGETASISIGLGTHIVTLNVKDDDANKDAAAINVEVMPAGASGTIKIIPRLCSLKNAVHVYNVSYPYTPCKLLNGGNTDCEGTNVSTITRCGGLTKFDFNKNQFDGVGTYDFYFSNAKAGSVRTGSIKVNVSTRSYPSILQVTATTNKDVNASGWVSYVLYEEEDCTIKKVAGPIKLQSVAGSEKEFFGNIDMSKHCAAKTCDFVLEILANSPPDFGGVVTFVNYTQTVSPLGLNASVGKSKYERGDSAVLSVSVTNATNVSKVSLECGFLSPASMVNETHKTFLFGAKKQIYTATISLPKAGLYTLLITANDTLVEDKTGSTTLSFNVSDIPNSSIDPKELDFSMEKGDSKTETLALKNTGALTISNLSVNISGTSLKEILEVSISKTSISAGQSATISAKFTMPDAPGKDVYNGKIIVKGTGVHYSVNVHVDVVGEAAGKGAGASCADNSECASGYCVHSVCRIATTYCGDTYCDTGETSTTCPADCEGAAFEGTVTPASWDIPSASPLSVQNKVFTLDISTQEYDGITATASVTPPSSAISLSREVISFSDGTEDFEVTLTVPAGSGEYSETVTVKFYDGGTLFSTKIIPITYETVDEVRDMIDNARSKYNRLQREIATLNAQAGAGTTLSKEIQTNITQAEESLVKADEDLLQAEMAFDDGDRELAKGLVTTANSGMSSVDEIIRIAKGTVDKGAEETKINLIPIFIALLFLTLFGFTILALREGWLPAHKVPWLIDAFKQMKLESLIEKPVDLTPKPRFARKPRPMPARPTLKAAPKPAAPAGAKTWEEYYKAHPEYAKKMREYYRSSYHRRYE